MGDIVETRRDNLRLLISQRYKDNHAKAGQDLGMGGSYIWRYFSMTSNVRKISTRRARDIEERIKLPKGWMDHPQGTPNAVVTGDAVQQMGVPLLSWEEAATYQSSIIEKKTVMTALFFVCPLTHSENTFATSVQGISMKNPYGSPSFDDGDYIFIDPAIAPSHKSFVLLKGANQHRAMLRQYVLETSGRAYGHILNRQSPEPTIVIDASVLVIGTVIARYTPLIT